MPSFEAKKTLNMDFVALRTLTFTFSSFDSTVLFKYIFLAGKSRLTWYRTSVKTK